MQPLPTINQFDAATPASKAAHTGHAYIYQVPTVQAKRNHTGQLCMRRRDQQSMSRSLSSHRQLQR